MNLYDTKQLVCICGKFLGEIVFDSVVLSPKCGLCTTNALKGSSGRTEFVIAIGNR